MAVAETGSFGGIATIAPACEVRKNDTAIVIF
jgi:hypothetical protein